MVAAMSARRLAVLMTHPVQYVRPALAAMASNPRLDVLVVFGCDHGVQDSLDPDFGVSFCWDCSPTEGFHHLFISHKPLNVLSRWVAAFPLAIKAWRTLLAYRPDAVLVFAYSPLFITLTTLLLRICGQRLLLRAEATDRALPRSGFKALVRDSCLRLFYQGFRFVFPIGSDSDQHFKRLGVPQSRRYPVLYAVDTDYFASQASTWLPQRSSLRQAFGIPQEDLVMLWSAKMTAVKHPALLLVALKQLPPEVRKRFWLLAVGDGPLRASFEEDAGSCLPSRTLFKGFLNQSELAASYAIADVLVFPSREGETWGLVVNEALQFGLAVIASDHAGSTRDLLNSSADIPRGSCVFPSCNAAALADALESFASAYPAGFTLQPVGHLPHPRSFAEAVDSVL
jgi:glycosyltransferase involved in cell wall biosynthesis